MLSQNPADHSSGQVGTSYSELVLRLISACILVGITVLGIYGGQFSFTCLVVIVSAFMLWEWCSLVSAEKFFTSFGISLVIVSLAIFCVYIEGLHISLLALVLGASAITVIGYFSYIAQRSAIWLGCALLYIGLPCAVMVWFRTDEAYGITAVLYLFSLVWITDSFAYLFGRALGGAKLWPAISPNKTWSGFIGGLTGSIVVGAVFSYYLEHVEWLPLIFISIVLGTVAQLGDLAESALKRNFGIKDTSSLIPGHGGILDRVDSLVFVVLIAGCFAFLVDASNPSRSLLYFGL